LEAVRRAEATDIERCRELLASAVAANDGKRGAALLFEGEPDIERPDALIARWMADEGAVVLVGTFSEAVVGLGVGRVVPLGDRSVGRIDCFYVEPGARAVGVGTALVEGLVGWFTGRGCTDVDAIALPGDRTSKQLLEASGFKARLLVLHRSLG
jgi:GNAT superfamily N-acetyltransferase